MDARGVRWAMEGPRCRNADPSDCTRCRALEGRPVRSTLGDQKKMQATDLDVETPSLRSCVFELTFRVWKKLQRGKKVFLIFLEILKMTWYQNRTLTQTCQTHRMANLLNFDSKQGIKKPNTDTTVFVPRLHPRPWPRVFSKGKSIIPSAPRHTRRHVFSLGCRCHAACNNLHGTCEASSEAEGLGGFLRGWWGWRVER